MPVNKCSSPYSLHPRVIHLRHTSPLKSSSSDVWCLLHVDWNSMLISHLKIVFCFHVENHANIYQQHHRRHHTTRYKAFVLNRTSARSLNTIHGTIDENQHLTCVRHVRQINSSGWMFFGLLLYISLCIIYVCDVCMCCAWVWVWVDCYFILFMHHSIRYGCHHPHNYRSMFSERNGYMRSCPSELNNIEWGGPVWRINSHSRVLENSSDDTANESLRNLY